MRIQAVDQQQNLYVIEDIVDPCLAQRIQSHDWSNAVGHISLPQPDWNRINLHWQHDALLRELDSALRWARYDIEQALGLDFSYCYTDFWLDRGGFRVPVHTDSIIASSMQLYWMGPTTSGTTFLNSKDPSDVRFQVPFRPNSGYLMLNMIQDGVQPLQWHGMFERTPPDVLRLTSYTRLGPYWCHR